MPNASWKYQSVPSVSTSDILYTTWRKSTLNISSSWTSSTSIRWGLMILIIKKGLKNEHFWNSLFLAVLTFICFASMKLFCSFFLILFTGQDSARDFLESYHRHIFVFSKFAVSNVYAQLPRSRLRGTRESMMSCSLWIWLIKVE